MSEDFEQNFTQQAFGEEDESMDTAQPKAKQPKQPKQQPKPQPGTPQQVAKAKRSRNVLVSLSLLFLIAGGALVWFGYQWLWPVISNQPSADLHPEATLPTDNDANPDSVPVTIVFTKIPIPDLVELFGLTTDEALARLGEGWAVYKVEDSDPPDPNNPEAQMPAIVQLVTLSFTPEVVATSGGGDPSGALGGHGTASSLPVAYAYLSMNSDGKVIEVYFSAEMDLLVYDQRDFMTLMGDDAFLRDVLGDAGIDPREFNYTAPGFEGSVTYDQPASENRKVTKMSTIYSGRAANEGLPTAWAVTVTYEYMPPVQDPGLAEKPRRMIYINLS